MLGRGGKAGVVAVPMEEGMAVALARSNSVMRAAPVAEVPPTAPPARSSWGLGGDGRALITVSAGWLAGDRGTQIPPPLYAQKRFSREALFVLSYYSRQ
jgi:hypothetical protein